MMFEQCFLFLLTFFSKKSMMVWCLPSVEWRKVFFLLFACLQNEAMVRSYQCFFPYDVVFLLYRCFSAIFFTNMQLRAHSGVTSTAASEPKAFAVSPRRLEGLEVLEGTEEKRGAPEGGAVNAESFHGFGLFG